MKKTVRGEKEISKGSATLTLFGVKESCCLSSPSYANSQLYQTNPMILGELFRELVYKLETLALVLAIQLFLEKKDSCTAASIKMLWLFLLLFT